MSRVRRRRGPILGALAAIVVVAVGGSVQLAANIGYDETRTQFLTTLDTAEGVGDDAGRAVDELQSVTDHAVLLVESYSGALGDPALSDGLSTAVAEAVDASAAVEEVTDDGLPTAGSKPTFFWELFPASERLSAQQEGLDDMVDDLSVAVPSVAAAETSVTDAGIALLDSASMSAGTFEAAHISAGNDAVIALREAASSASQVSVVDQGAVDALIGLQDAAAEVIASEQSELAQKSGPLQGARLEVEAFARSLAPGVLLEFDWNPLVNNAGYNGSMGGLTTWWWDEPDRAVIELSNSVAEQWPAERSRALVAHEVGHAISVKCEEMYDSTTQDSIEKWATAWAISMGFTDDANGVWAYGYPPQSYIDAAYGCR
nr:hypothetical protein [uncultured Microbacterium sp.]